MDAGTRLQAEELWQRHGMSAYALACALLGDEAAAMRAVALGLTDFACSDVSTSPADARRSLARRVYQRSIELAGETSTTMVVPPTMAWLAQLAHLQRASLALCVFGAHTHEEAAGVLGVPPLTVAQLLTTGLRELSRLHPTEVAVSG